MVVRAVPGPFTGRGSLPALLVPAALVLALLPGWAAAAGEEPQEPVVPFMATEVTRAAARAVTYGDRVVVAGQVVFTAPLGETTYAVDDAEVTLERRYLREDTWTSVGTDVTDGDLPVYRFEERAVRSAAYRVTYAGDATFLPSSAQATVRVHRAATSTVTEPRDEVFRLRGRVLPTYAGRVYLTRRSCADCGWTTVGSERATGDGRYRFALTLPETGTRWFRVRVPASRAYLVGYSETWRLVRAR